MSMSFGRRWESQYGEVESNEFWFWAKALSDYSDEQVELGIEKTMNHSERVAAKGETPFPPDLFAFKSYCREAAVHPMNQLYIAGPNKDNIRKAGISKLEQMRSQLRA